MSLKWRQYRALEPNEFLVVGGDCPVGVNDYSCLQFMSKNQMDVPLVYHSEKLATEMTNDLHPVLERIYDITNIRPLVAYERNNGGAFEMERLATMNREDKYEVFMMPTLGKTRKPKEDVKYGWNTSTATRPKMLGDLKEALDNNLIRIYDKPTLEECFSFIIEETSSSYKAQAESNAHDDLVMSLAVAYQVYLFSPSIHERKGPKPMPRAVGGHGRGR